MFRNKKTSSDKSIQDEEKRISESEIQKKEIDLLKEKIRLKADKNISKFVVALRMWLGK